MSEKKATVLTDDEGNIYRLVTNANDFPTYQDALNYVNNQDLENYRIVGTNQFISPISLEAVPDYKLVYSSESCQSHQDVGMIPEVKIFEYIGD